MSARQSDMCAGQPHLHIGSDGHECRSDQGRAARREARPADRGAAAVAQPAATGEPGAARRGAALSAAHVRQLRLEPRTCQRVSNSATARGKPLTVLLDSLTGVLEHLVARPPMLLFHTGVHSRAGEECHLKAGGGPPVPRGGQQVNIVRMMEWCIRPCHMSC